MQDPWKLHRTGKPFGNDFTDITRFKGFWIYVNATDGTILVVDGAAPVDTYINQVFLQPGWNYIGYPSVSTRDIIDALSGITYDAVYHYEQAGGWTGYGVSTQNDLTMMKPGEGYWIHVSSGQVLELQYAL
jgi:hypothetical protein